MAERRRRGVASSARSAFVLCGAMVIAGVVCATKSAYKMDSAESAWALASGYVLFFLGCVLVVLGPIIAGSVLDKGIRPVNQSPFSRFGFLGGLAIAPIVGVLSGVGLAGVVDSLTSGTQGIWGYLPFVSGTIIGFALCFAVFGAVGATALNAGWRAGGVAVLGFGVPGGVCGFILAVTTLLMANAGYVQEPWDIVIEVTFIAVLVLSLVLPLAIGGWALGREVDRLIAEKENAERIKSPPSDAAVDVR